MHIVHNDRHYQGQPHVWAQFITISTFLRSSAHCVKADSDIERTCHLQFLNELLRLKLNIIPQLLLLYIRDLRSFEIQFDFESNFRFGIRFVVMIRFEIFESSAPPIVLCKETIGGG